MKKYINKKFFTEAVVGAVFAVLLLTMRVYSYEEYAPQKDYELANELFSRGNYTLAETLYRFVEIEYPAAGAAGRVIFMRAESKYKNGDYPGALKDYSAVLDKYIQTGHKYKKEIYYRMAQCYSMIQKHDEAVYYAEIVIRQFPGSYLEKDARLLLGENYFLKKDYDRAVKNLDLMEKHEEYEHFDYVYYLLGRIYYDRFLNEEKNKRMHASESLKFFDRVINKYPESIITPHAEFRKANVLYGQGRYEEALKAVKAVKDKGVNQRFELMLDYFAAWNYFMLKKYDSAVNIYSSIIKNYPDDILAVWAEYKKGLCFEEQGKEKDAVEIYTGISEKFSDSVPAAYAEYALGLHLYKKEEFYPALDRFDRVLSKYKIEELHRACVFMKADIYGKLNKHYLAKKEYEIIEKNYPRDKNTAEYMQGWSYFKEGDFSEAEEIFKKLIKSDGTDEEIKAKSILKLGDTYFERKEYEKARKEYSKVIGRFGRHPELVFEATYGRGWVNYRMEKIQEAKNDFYTARKRAVNPEQKLRSDFMRANALYGLYEFKPALDIYMDIISTKNAGKGIRNEAYFYAGWCYYRLERFSLAVSFWEKYMAGAESRVKKAETIYRIGWAHFRDDDFDKAVKRFDEIIKNYTDTHFYQEALLKKGDSLYNQRNYTQAAEAYTALVEKFPEHYRVPEALYGIQWSYYQLGEEEKAIELSKEFLKKYRGSSFAPEIQYRVAEHYYNAGKTETALKEYRKFLEQNPDHEMTPNALYWSGEAALSLRKYNEAINYFKEFMSRFPESNFQERALFKSANAYYRLHQYEQAAARYIEFSENYSDSRYVDDAYFNTAMSYRKMEKNDETEKWYKKLITEMPDSELAERSMLNLSYLYQDTEKYEKALEWFGKTAAKKGPRAVEAQFWIADIYDTKGDHDRAVKEYLKVYEEFGENEMWAVSAIDAAGKIYEKQGRLKKAAEIYRKIKEATKQKKYIDTAEEKIKLLEQQYELLNPEKTPKGPVRQDDGGGE